jgi:hypothetical protein
MFRILVDGQRGHRSKNVAFHAFSCATVPVLSEGGPAKWLKNKNLLNHLCDYEPGGREFDNLAVFGQVDRPKGDPEGVSAQRE